MNAQVPYETFDRFVTPLRVGVPAWWEVGVALHTRPLDYVSNFRACARRLRSMEGGLPTEIIPRIPQAALTAKASSQDEQSTSSGGGPPWGGGHEAGDARALGPTNATTGMRA